MEEVFNETTPVTLLGDRVAIKLFQVEPESSPAKLNLVMTGVKNEKDLFKYSRNPAAGMVYFVGDGIVGDHTVDMRNIRVGSIVILDRIPGIADFNNGRLFVNVDGEDYYIARRNEIMTVLPHSGTFEENQKKYNQIKAKNYEENKK